MSGAEVRIPRPDGSATTAYASLPAEAERGVVVIHELFGRQPEIDRVVDRFAAAGYAAVGPDLFANRVKPACIRRALATIESGERLRQRLRTLGQAEPEVHTYDSVGHSFLTDGDHPIAVALTWPLFQIRYDPSVAEHAWGEILGFFDRTL